MPASLGPHSLQRATPPDTLPIRLAIVSTTIHDEGGYLPFDELAIASAFDEVSFFVSGDRQTPNFDVGRFQCPIQFLDVAAQSRFRCSEEIGWNTIGRRNTALLAAIEQNPDYILLVDDDNIPPQGYFDAWYRVLTADKRRVLTCHADVEDKPKWFNYLRTSDAEITIFPRGFPFTERPGCDSTIDEVDPPLPVSEVGLFQGISLGDPDIDAMTRIICAPHLTRVEETNYLVRDVWSPYNSQNTVIAKCLFPLAFMWPFCGRYDDIYASFVWQAFLFRTGRYVHVGEAMNRQARRTRDTLRDLEQELEGYRRAESVWRAVRTVEATDAIAYLRSLIDVQDNEIVARSRRFFESFLTDVEKVMGNVSASPFAGLEPSRNPELGRI